VEHCDRLAVFGSHRVRAGQSIQHLEVLGMRLVRLFKCCDALRIIRRRRESLPRGF
jgi:hypothetical protein